MMQASIRCQLKTPSKLAYVSHAETAVVTSRKLRLFIEYLGEILRRAVSI
jgi:hypothetical protein